VPAVRACIWCFIGVLVLSFNEIAYSLKKKTIIFPSEW
jgi:hypothetical protein